VLFQHHPVNIRDHAGWTPLHEAANHGYKDIVDLLLSHGANIDDKGGIDCDGVTPLHDAASNGCMDVMELLLTRGADITAKTYTKPVSYSIYTVCGYVGFAIWFSLYTS
jgi:NF-kappa-B inhibitor-like protein 2